MQEVADWLKTLGLAQYAATFEQNGVDLEVLPSLTDQDLEKLGVLLGHRRKLLRAFQTLTKSGPPVPEAHVAAVSSDLGERRQLSLLFCDLVDSTSLSTRLDPEDLRRVYRSYRDGCARVVGRYDGTIAQFMGDGVLVYFGFPRAHEDDAERAVRAGLDIVAAVGWLRTPSGERVRARAGIATGLVVVDDLVRHGFGQEHSVIGATANMAARLQAVAEPGTVVVAASTRRLLGRMFSLRPLGRLNVKGVTSALEAWAVEGEAPAGTRFEMVRSRRLTSFVGRESEVGQLKELQQRAWGGEGQIVVVSGEAGIGKSRFVGQLRDDFVKQPHMLLRYQCSPYHTMSAFYPIVDQLRRAAGFKADDSILTRLEKLEATLALATPTAAEVAPLFAALLSIPSEDRYPPLGLSAAQRRNRLILALLDQLEGLARKQPVLLVFEDAHWADASSLEVLRLLAERVRTLPALVLVTCRPEFEPPWAALPNVHTLQLERLEPAQVRQLIQQLTGGKALPPEVVTRIVAKADGVPLFVEELTRTMLESGVLVEQAGAFRLKGPLPSLAIPATLQDSLMARLDRQAAVKEIAQVGAAIGREFPYALLHAVSGADRAALDAALLQLERAGLLFRIGAPPDLRYSFTHALVQEAACESLLRSRRLTLHRRIAEVICDRFPVMAEAEPELVAYHFTEAGVTASAVEWWSLAGERALARSAFVEACAHYHQAISLAKTLDHDPTWLRRKLNLYLAHGQALISAKGHGSHETTSAFVQARALADGLNDPEAALAALYGLWAGSNVRGELATAQELADRFLQEAGRQAGLPEVGVGHWIVGMTHFMAGALLPAREHLERAVSIYDAKRDVKLRWRFGQDPGVAAMFQLAMVLWQLGDCARAVQLADEATSLALQSGHVPTLACGLGCRCLFEGMLNNESGARPFAEALFQLIQDHAIQSIWLGIGTFFQGWTLRDSAGLRVGTQDMRKGVCHFIEQGFSLYSALLHGLLASTEAAANNAEGALASVDIALADVERTGHRWYQAELLRLRAEILLRHRPDDRLAIEHSYRSAVSVARETGAKMLELRAGVGLARLYGETEQGKRVHAQLKPILTMLGRDPESIEQCDPCQH